jgi:hypothetical protein
LAARSEPIGTKKAQNRRAGSVTAPVRRRAEAGRSVRVESKPTPKSVLTRSWRYDLPNGTATSAVASGNKAALEVTWKGTHTGPLESAEGTIPASGKRQETPAAFFFTFEGDKIKESRHYFDSLTLLKQIGAQPK